MLGTWGFDHSPLSNSSPSRAAFGLLRSFGEVQGYIGIHIQFGAPKCPGPKILNPVRYPKAESVNPESPRLFMPVGMFSG